MSRIIDLTGKRFGKLTVLGRSSNTASGQARWLCKCDCGENTTVIGQDLRNGKTKSCGCEQHLTYLRYESLVGKRFGMYEVLERVDDKSRSNTMYKCKCDCGNIRIVDSYSLKSGLSKSCGCKNKNRLKHGKRQTRIYRIWSGMKSRCNNKAFKDYHGKGITYCEEWEDFENFYKWAMSNGYSDNLSIDRIDVNGNYEPSNCRWADNFTQANNKNDNHYIEIDGVTHTISEWERLYGFKQGTIKSRIKYGWSGSDLLKPTRR